MRLLTAMDPDTADRLEVILEIQMPNGSDAGMYANRIKSRLLELSDHEVSCELTKTNTNTMDFGSTLVLIFGTPAAIAVARGIHEAAKRLSNAVVIKTRSGHVIATGDAAARMSIDEVTKALTSDGRLNSK